jgi:hypothetical protein
MVRIASSGTLYIHRRQAFEVPNRVREATTLFSTPFPNSCVASLRPLDLIVEQPEPREIDVQFPIDHLDLVGLPGLAIVRVKYHALPCGRNARS